ncbi:hypothetical protein P9112_012322 [Eukaryota sp. TZLM1-RC]
MSKKKTSLDTRIFDLLDKAGTSVNIPHLQSVLDDVEPKEIVNTINELNKRCLVDLIQENGQLVVSRRSHEEAEKLRTLAEDERLVFTHIARTGNQGIWIKELRFGTNFPAPHLTKLLKTLQNRKLVKSVKSVQHKSRKVYMLYDLEPSATHTGGLLYDDNQNFDYNFVDNLLKIIVAIVRKKGHKGVSVKDIHNEIRQRGLTKNVDLPEDMVETLCNVCVLDGELNETKKLDDLGHYVSFFTVFQPIPLVDYVSCVPCTRCPVRRKCLLQGEIGPLNCLYLTEWISGVSGFVGEGDIEDLRKDRSDVE